MILGVGVDVVEVERLARAVERDLKPFLAEFLTPGEMDECAGRGHPERAWAARFAAKEAIVKALAADGSVGLPWRSIETRARPGGFAVSLRGALAETSDRRGVSAWRVAVAADRLRAWATAVAEGEEVPTTESPR